MDDAYANVPGVEYIDIAYDLYEGKGTAKVKVGERVCRFSQKEQGIIPRILQDLIGQRKATRASIKNKAATIDGIVHVGTFRDGVIKDASGHEHIVPEGVAVEDAYSDFQKTILDGLQVAYKVRPLRPRKARRLASLRTRT